MLGLTLEPLLFLFVHEKPEQFKHHADYDLTPRELRLLKLLAEGHNHNSAAAEVAVSFQIAFHIQTSTRSSRCTPNPKPWRRPCAIVCFL